MEMLEYSLSSYRSDFERFVESYRGDASWHLPVGLLGPSSPETIIICDCSLQAVERAMSCGLKDRQLFSINVALEAILFAGVHQYDRANFSRYIAALGVALYVERHHAGGVCHPHILLAGGGAWSERSADRIQSGCLELLPGWVQAYDEKFGTSRGRHIIRSLAADPDLKRNPYGVLSPEAMHALQAGFQGAALL